MNFSIKYTLVAFAFLISVSIMHAQSTAKMMEKGQQSYDNKSYDEAISWYEKAAAKEGSPDAKYNLGNSQYQKGQFEEAAKNFAEAAKNTEDSKIRSRAAYNKGNALYKSEKYQESIEAYKEALKLNPADQEARHNLMHARKARQEQQQQEQQQQDQQNQSENKNKQDPSQDQNQDQNPPQDPKPEEQKDAKKENTDQLLKIMEEEESRVQQKLRNQQSRPNRSSKNW